MVIFLYNLYIFVWIEHDCLAYTVFALDLSNCVIKKFWCNNIILLLHKNMLWYSLELSQ